MRNEKIILAEIDVDIKPYIESQKTLENQLKILLDKQMEMFASGKKNTQEYKELTQTINTLNEKYNVQAKLISEKLKANEKLIAKQKALEASIAKTNKTENEYVKNNKKLIKLRSELNVNSDNYQKNLDLINTKLQENNKWISENASAQTRLNTTFDGYKSQVKDSFNQINLLNGGLGGFISRAQEAGGVMPLLSSGLKGITSGIGGMTKASLSFIATPIGAIIAALGLAFKAVSSYLTGTQEGMDKLTAVTRPLQSVFSALMTVFQNVGKFLVDAFSNPVESIEKFATLIKDNIVNRFTGLLELIPNLGKAIGLLFKGEFSEAAKVAADAAGKVALGTENITDKISEAAAETNSYLTEAYNRGKKIDELQKALDKSLAEYTKNTSKLSIELDKQNTIADDTNRTFEERETAAKKAIDTATAHNKLIADRMQQEIELLRIKYQENGFTDAEKAELADLVAKRNEAIAQHQAGEKALYDKVDSIHSEHETKEKERRQKQRDANSEEAKRLQLNLDLYMQAQSQKEMSAEEEIAYLKNIQEQKTAIAKAEFAATARTKNDELALKLKLNQIEIDSSKEQAEVAIANANLKLANYLENHKSKITAETELTAEIIAEENKRLEGIKEQKLKTLAVELGTNDEIIKAKRAKNQLLSEEDLAYLAQKEEIENEHKATVKENNEALEEQEKAEKVAKHEEEFQQKLALAANEYDQQRIIENERYAQELAEIEQRKIDENLSDQASNALKEQAQKNHSANLEEIKKAEFNNKVELAKGAYNNIATILGKESEAGKAMAIAQATIDTFKSAVSAYGAMSGIPIVGPALGALAAGAAVVAGVKNVKKIASTKPAKAPKAEKGALFNIGGNRHSNGGTMFTGADGTQFEAEQGELIGVMNRNAASHFMAFNNAFPAGGSSPSTSNYFANGGIVSRDIATPGVNTDELATKIAQANSNIPAPVVSVQDIVTEGDSYVQVRQGADF
ncbi:hypothetical protein DVK85_06680 [Flavobacterium arcticum]|uniref:Bacteriophage tail tape measure N-terminal domain-containing protein n=1 Tax=Flavobacterium arcticum TaxID=1784713 RepID=A0A345HBI5_9FLAO|nr:hypothetical protein [Flavobacterium arcticum]AXG73945.1 hypothetical protein DVK85_06680 [Flavobacterium arcticum]KAF2508921.1 hypothetical protein E0W72_10165 [Flavobacterium arcticum]